ncbi:MAG: hypothetical protein FWF03_06115, partial [Defluviitaleaceae bacterium]|nr:hypothetical protein [Defluviitaleaceae bacterium]
MEFVLYGDIREYYADTYMVYMEHEAQNLVPLGNIIVGNEGRDKTGWRDPSGWLMAAVKNKGRVALTAIMTPPHNVALYAAGNAIEDKAVELLAGGLVKTDFEITGALADSVLSEKFAARYAEAAGLAYSVNKRMRIYELTRVNPEINIVGTLRKAEPRDMSFLPYWSEGFSADCFGSVLSPGADAAPYRYHIDSGYLYILDVGGTSVSMAKAHREMATVCGVGFVYTPPYFRGRGHATSCVAAV